MMGHLALSLSRSLKPLQRRALLEHFGSVKSLFASSQQSIDRWTRRHSVVLESKAELLARAQSMDKNCQRLGIAILRFDQSEYPLRLRHVFDPPPVLYVKGDLKNWNLTWARRSFCAVVGTRRPDAFVADRTEELCEGLVEAGVAVVSGLAKGVDSRAHRGALKKTLAVLGAGIDVIYPKENAGLQRDILESGGLLISQYPPGTQPLRYHFPQRNQLISGLSDAVLLMEAPEKSGALITLKSALEQNREIFVHRPYSRHPRFWGNWKYIEEGATAVEGQDAILDFFLDSPTPLPVETQKASSENRIGEFLLSQPRSLGELCAVSGQTEEEMLISLVPKIIAGIIVEMPGKKYYLNRKNSPPSLSLK